MEAFILQSSTIPITREQFADGGRTVLHQWIPVSGSDEGTADISLRFLSM